MPRTSSLAIRSTNVSNGMRSRSAAKRRQYRFASNATIGRPQASLASCSGIAGSGTSVAPAATHDASACSMRAATPGSSASK